MSQLKLVNEGKNQTLSNCGKKVFLGTSLDMTDHAWVSLQKKWFNALHLVKWPTIFPSHETSFLLPFQWLALHLWYLHLKPRHFLFDLGICHSPISTNWTCLFHKQQTLWTCLFHKQQTILSFFLFFDKANTSFFFFFFFFSLFPLILKILCTYNKSNFISLRAFPFFS